MYGICLKCSLGTYIPAYQRNDKSLTKLVNIIKHPRIKHALKRKYRYLHINYVYDKILFSDICKFSRPIVR